jgi:hypothetical protein
VQIQAQQAFENPQTPQSQSVLTTSGGILPPLQREKKETFKKTKACSNQVKTESGKKERKIKKEDKTIKNHELTRRQDACSLK